MRFKTINAAKKQQWEIPLLFFVFPANGRPPIPGPFEFLFDFSPLKTDTVLGSGAINAMPDEAYYTFPGASRPEGRRSA